MADVETEITQMFQDYVKAYSTLDPGQFLAYYNRPLMMAGPRGVTVLNTTAEMEASFAPGLKRLRDEGYGRSEWTEIRVQVLSDKTAYANNTAARYKKSGELLERSGTSYVVYRTDQGWKVAVMMSRTR